MLLDKLKRDRIQAMKDKDAVKRNTLQLIIANVEKAQIEKQGTMSDSDVEKVIQKYWKDLDKEVETYKELGKDTSKQEAEKNVLLEYIPKKMSEEEVREYVYAMATQLRETSMSIGESMKSIMGQLGSKAEGKHVSKYVKELFSE